MSAPKRTTWPWYALFVAPFVGTLWVPLYNKRDPAWGGIPYFYWYQFVWIAVSAALTALVYWVTREEP